MRTIELGRLARPRLEPRMRELRLPTGLAARSSDPIRRLRGLTKPRIAAHLHRQLPPTGAKCWPFAMQDVARLQAFRRPPTRNRPSGRARTRCRAAPPVLARDRVAHAPARRRPERRRSQLRHRRPRCSFERRAAASSRSAAGPRPAVPSEDPLVTGFRRTGRGRRAAEETPGCGRSATLVRYMALSVGSRGRGAQPA